MIADQKIIFLLKKNVSRIFFLCTKKIVLHLVHFPPVHIYKYLIHIYILVCFTFLLCPTIIKIIMPNIFVINHFDSYFHFWSQHQKAKLSIRRKISAKRRVNLVNIKTLFTLFTYLICLCSTWPKGRFVDSHDKFCPEKCVDISYFWKCASLNWKFYENLRAIKKKNFKKNSINPKKAGGGAFGAPPVDFLS